ncbi:MAG: energy transducer TonB [Bacteroidia bacterium]|nr:energy transducer TonB [Bacteroidia bacterium]
MKHNRMLARRSTGFLGLVFLLLLSHCKSREKEAKSSTESTSHSLVEKISDSLATFSEASGNGPSAQMPPVSIKDTALLTKQLPPPKKEPWMDTLTDLTGMPAPNAAAFVEDEPNPLNLSSVAILIAHRYRPKRPIELTLRVFVTEGGTVRRYQLLRSSDQKLTPEYFVPALLELRFSPAMHNGKPVSTWTTISLKIPNV